MGDNILESQAKHTEKRRARRAADEQQGRLFQRPERVHDEFTVHRMKTKSTLSVGDQLHCYAGKDTASVDVVFENQKIGVVSEGGGEVLSEVTRKTGCKTAIVRSICELSNTVRIQLKEN